ncbi:MAG: peptidase C39 family protein [Candidatus Micrarchaeota archaeon]|nr:peptidase C39 family protein [Candidatus Micrarchaeota archaeon]
MKTPKKAKKTSDHGSRKSARAAPKLKDRVFFEIPHYPQTEDFTSSAACAMMVLKFVNHNFKMRKEQEYSIWQEAVNGSVWHGSKYGLAYALAKRGIAVSIISNTKDEGYDRKLAVYENVNLDTLTASYNEIKQKSQNMKISEEHSGAVSANLIKRTLSTGKIPIVLIDANAINPYLESSPHWIVVKGYDRDAFYINDPYSDSTITLDAEAFKSALGYDSNFHMIVTDAKRSKKS